MRPPVGSTEKMSQEMWVYDEVADSIVKRAVTFVPGLYKIFDEIIVNAADNKQRDENMSKLKVRRVDSPMRPLMARRVAHGRSFLAPLIDIL